MLYFYHFWSNTTTMTTTTATYSSFRSSYFNSNDFSAFRMVFCSSGFSEQKLKKDAEKIVDRFSTRPKAKQTKPYERMELWFDCNFFVGPLLDAYTTGASFKRFPMPKIEDSHYSHCLSCASCNQRMPVIYGRRMTVRNWAMHSTLSTRNRPHAQPNITACSQFIVRLTLAFQMKFKFSIISSERRRLSISFSHCHSVNYVNGRFIFTLEFRFLFVWVFGLMLSARQFGMRKAF